MKRLLGLHLIILLVFGFSSKLDASILAGGFITHLEDDDFEAVYRLDAGTYKRVNTLDNKIAKDDFFLAIARFNFLKNAVTDATYQVGSNDNNAITAVSLLKVASATTSGGGFIGNLVLAPASNAEWTGVTGGLVTPSAVGGTALIAYNDPPSAPNNHVIGVGVSIAAGITSAIEGTPIAEFGFNGTPGEFVSASTLFGIGGSDPLDITEITTVSGFGALNTTYLYPAGIAGFSPHDFLGFGAESDLQFSLGLEGGSKGLWDFRTDTDAYIQFNIPEPGTIAIWSVLGVVGIAVARRRRKRS